MEAPKCKLCGGRHYGICPTLPEITLESTPQDTKSLMEPEFHVKKPAFDRNVYQKQYMRKYMKEYMRKRRSTAKALGS